MTTTRSDADPDTMTREEAVAWLHRVDAELYRTPRGGADGPVWVAVVRVPRPGARAGRLIVALGGTLQEAATAAASQWHVLHESARRVH
jgi:hypothetical protein